jgi:hypothetical protein
LAPSNGAAICIFDPRYFGRPVAIAAITVSLAGCSSLLGLQVPLARPIDMFDAVVFAQEYEDRSFERLTKWAGPIRIALKGSGATHYRSLIVSHADTLSGLTGLPIHLAPGEARANVTIAFGTLEAFAKAAGPRIASEKHRLDLLYTSGCLFFYDTDEAHRIISAAIFIRTDHQDERISACILEEMVQILGLPNDSDLIYPSIFNTNDGLTALTPLDAALVGALYNPNVSVGAERAEALSIAEGLLE